MYIYICVGMAYTHVNTHDCEAMNAVVPTEEEECPHCQDLGYEEAYDQFRDQVADFTTEELHESLGRLNRTEQSTQAEAERDAVIEELETR